MRFISPLHNAHRFIILVESLFYDNYHKMQIKPIETRISERLSVFFRQSELMTIRDSRPKLNYQRQSAGEKRKKDFPSKLK